jgi:hypothetical protein
MKIEIGPYSSDLIPVRRWEGRYQRWRSGSYYHNEEDWNWFDEIVYRGFEILENLVLPLNRWSNDRPRKIKIHIDNYDVWSADHTLALIIHPVLLKLKQVKHGSGMVDPSDVPEHLRPSEEAGPSNGYTDNTVHERWDWVLDEMIWAFEQASKHDRGEDQFHHNIEQLEMISTPVENSKLFNIEFNDQKDPAKPKYWVDTEAEKLHNDRIENGLRLFAKYYFNLWD